MSFFDERWITLLLFITFIGVILRTPALTGLGVLSMALIAISAWLRERVLRDVMYERRFNETRLFLGEIFEVSCNLINRSRFPVVSVSVDDAVPAGFQLPEADEFNADERISLNQISALKPGDHTARVTRVRAMKRGYYAFGSAHLRAFDMLGMSLCERIDKPKDALIVYPRVFPMEALGIPTRDPLGSFAALRRLIEDPSRIMGARDYRYGDPFRQIHWKASAHAGTLQTRVSEHTSEPTAIIMLNVTTYEQDWRGTDVERFEWALSVAGSLAVWADENAITLGLSSNGTAPYVPEALRVRPRRSPGQLARILESLAVMFSFTLSSFDIFLLTEQRHVPLGATLLVVTPIVNPAMLAALLRLHNLGKNVILISADRRPPEVVDLPFAVFHVPPAPDFWAGSGPGKSGVWDGRSKAIQPVSLDATRARMPGVRATGEKTPT